MGGLVDADASTGWTGDWQAMDDGRWRLRVTGDYVFVSDLALPPVVEVEFHADESVPVMHGRVELRNGRPELVELRLSSPPAAREIRQADLRGIDVRSFVETLIGAMSFRVRRDDQGALQSIEGLHVPSSAGFNAVTLESMERAVEGLRAGTGPRSLTPQLLARVAEIYRTNVASKPTQAVARAFNVRERAASGYVQRARAAGLLPPTTAGKKQA